MYLTVEVNTFQEAITFQQAAKHIGYRAELPSPCSRCAGVIMDRVFYTPESYDAVCHSCFDTAVFYVAEAAAKQGQEDAKAVMENGGGF